MQHAIYSHSIFNRSTQAGGRVPWDTPNRVISRGAFPTKRGGLLLSYSRSITRAFRSAQ